MPTPSSELPVISSLVDCEYTVVAGDTAGEIADSFDAELNQVFRLDDTQENMNVITPGEILIIKGISAEACINGNGVIRSETISTP